MNSRGTTIVRISAVNTGEDIIVRVTVTNRGRFPYRLLLSDLPADGWMSKPLFFVYRDDQKMTYMGAEPLREIDEDDYVTVDPGHTCSAMIGLAQAYDVKPKARYRIRYEAMNEHVAPDFAEWLKSNKIVVQRK